MPDQGGIPRSVQDYGLLSTVFGMGFGGPDRPPQGNRSDQMAEFLMRKREADEAQRKRRLMDLLRQQYGGQ